MLRTRLWMGALLIVLAAGALFVDELLAPWFPVLFALITTLSLACTLELWSMLPSDVRPARGLCIMGIAGLIAANWLPHLPSLDHSDSAWAFIAGVFAALVLIAFFVEMATFHAPGNSVTRIALSTWLFAYLGLLPSFLAQLRWHSVAENATAALAMAIFVPKSCDIGAYCTGRLIGRHKMSPVLSPKKTWEGACGGLVTAVLTAALLDRLGPAPLLRGDLALECGFGLSAGIAGMLGDLAESLIKRDFAQKDASQAVPGFGGVLDVVDAILFAAPVSYVWFQTIC